MTLISYLKETPTKELVRALNSSKNYCFFDISVFNCGMRVLVKNTDIYKERNPNTWNGYDFILENDATTKFYIIKVLLERFETLNKRQKTIVNYFKKVLL